MTNKKTTTSSTPTTSTRHKDKRVNIPTKELESFMEKEEQEPKTILYPRDPSLDPQLVWKGKDEQDQQALEVPAVPVYIQEKIEPRAIKGLIAVKVINHYGDEVLKVYGVK